MINEIRLNKLKDLYFRICEDYEDDMIYAKALYNSQFKEESYYWGGYADSLRSVINELNFILYDVKYDKTAGGKFFGVMGGRPKKDRFEVLDAYFKRFNE